MAGSTQQSTSVPLESALPGVCHHKVIGGPRVWEPSSHVMSVETNSLRWWFGSFSFPIYCYIISRHVMVIVARVIIAFIISTTTSETVKKIGSNANDFFKPQKGNRNYPTASHV